MTFFGYGLMRILREIYKKISVLRRQTRDTNRNIKRSVYIAKYTDISSFLSDEGPMFETLHYSIRIGSTPTVLYFDTFSVDWPI